MSQSEVRGLRPLPVSRVGACRGLFRLDSVVQKGIVAVFRGSEAGPPRHPNEASPARYCCDGGAQFAPIAVHNRAVFR